MQSSIFQKDIYKVDAVICKMCFMSSEELNILVINSGFPNLEAIAQKIFKINIIQDLEFIVYSKTLKNRQIDIL